MCVFQFDCPHESRSTCQCYLRFCVALSHLFSVPSDSCKTSTAQRQHRLYATIENFRFFYDIYNHSNCTIIRKNISSVCTGDACVCYFCKFPRIDGETGLSMFKVVEKNAPVLKEKAIVKFEKKKKKLF